MSVKIKVSIAIVVSVIAFLLFIALGMTITFERPAALHAAQDDDTPSDQLDPAGRLIMLQRPTVLHHLRQFETFPVGHHLRHVRHDPESGLT